MNTMLLTGFGVAVQRAGLLLVLFSIAQGCGRDTPVLVTLLGDLRDAEGIDITPSLDGQLGAVLHLKSTDRQLVLRIPSGKRGVLHLEADEINSHLGSCPRINATADVTVESGSTMPVEVKIDWGQVHLPLCFSMATFLAADALTAIAVGDINGN